MNRNKVSLGRILGIPIGLDYSWFLMFILLTWTLAVGFYPEELKKLSAVQDWILSAGTAVMLFASVLLHELGHSVVARRYNIPLKSITLYIFGGISEISEEPPNPRAQFWISIIGPLVSFALGLIFWFLQPFITGMATLLVLDRYLAFINFGLGIFNLIPGFPLDGGGVFLSIVWSLTHNKSRATLIAANLGRIIALLFIFLGVWQVLGTNPFNGIWIAFIGWFLLDAATSQVQQIKVEQLVAGHKVFEVMTDAYVVVSPNTTLQQLVDEHFPGRGKRSIVVEEGNQVLGLLTSHHIKDTPRSDWPTTTVAQVMVPLSKLKRIQPDTELWSTIESMNRDGVNQLPVMTNGHIEGMLTREDVLSFLRDMKELETT
jgi:Zn-dependent protease/predicted transcriptional regulator